MFIYFIAKKESHPQLQDPERINLVAASAKKDIADLILAHLNISDPRANYVLFTNDLIQENRETEG